jgi:GlpG protein
MRQVGDSIVGRRRADRFVAFLGAQGISSELRDDGDDSFAVWVIHEDHVAAAAEHYQAYRVAPEAAVFDVVAPPPSPPPPAKAARPAGRDRSRFVDVRSEIFAGGNLNRVAVTIGLIVISALLTLLKMTPRLEGLLGVFYFSRYVGTSFPEIMHGQIWRLITPVFIHNGPLHLLFNMMWLYQLGGAIEVHEGKRYYAFLLVLLSVIVNCIQYLLIGPNFMGMSGVVYGLLGYVWMMSRYQVGTRYVMETNTVMFMLGWLVICLIGVMGPNVANAEHISGLITGVVWGLLRSDFIKTWLRQRRYKG